MQNSTLKRNIAHVARKLREAQEALDNAIDLEEAQSISALLGGLAIDLQWLEGEIRNEGG